MQYTAFTRYSPVHMGICAFPYPQAKQPAWKYNRRLQNMLGDEKSFNESKRESKISESKSSETGADVNASREEDVVQHLLDANLDIAHKKGQKGTQDSKARDVV